MSLTQTGITEHLAGKRDQILALAARYHAFNVRVFGSVARGEAAPGSDVDFLVDFYPGATVWDAVGLWRALGELLDCEVNVVAEEPPGDPFMRSVLDEAVPL